MKKIITLFAFILTSSALAQTAYSPMSWGLNKGVTPYAFGANINGTWSNLGTVSSAGVWQIPLSNIGSYYRVGTTTDQVGTQYPAGVMTIGPNNLNLNVPYLTSENIAYGIGVLTNVTTGFQNIGVGDWVLASITSGYGNVGVGQQVLQRSTTGVFNTGIGTAVLRYLDDSAGPTTANVGLGHGAMAGDDFGFYPMTGSGNTALGNWTMQELTSGQRNIAVGMNAGMNLQTGNDNTIVGFAAQVCSFDSYNTRVPGGCAASANVAIGSQALQTNKATGNVGIGYYALNNNTTGDYNTAVGYNALKNATTAQGNLAIGPIALDQTTTGGFNTAVGGYALHGVGDKAFNTAIGWGAGTAVTTGAGNVLIGWTTGGSLTTGSSNTFIGTAAGTTATTLINATALGQQAEPTNNNEVRLGNTNIALVTTSGAYVGTGFRNSGSGISLTSCGTSPSVAANSNNSSGAFTTGTGTPTACTITFIDPYPTSARCTVTPASSNAAAIVGGYYISAQSNSAYTLTLGTGTDNATFNYTCGGN